MADDIRIRMLTPDDVAARISASLDLVILDVRTEEEWAERHIPSATLLPMNKLRARLPELDPQRETIVLCEHGMRSQSVAQYLVAQAGFTNVSNMVGGMSEWVGQVESG